MALVVGLIVLVASLAIVASRPDARVVLDSEGSTSGFGLTVTPSCPDGTWSPPAPGELTGACRAITFLDLPSVSRLTGDYAAQNDSPLWVVISFWAQTFDSTQPYGSFGLTGHGSLDCGMSTVGFQCVNPPAAASITVVSNYPIRVSLTGNYTSFPSWV